MSKRITPAERLHAEIDEVFAGSQDLAGAIERVARLSAQVLLQTALEAEVSEFLGRQRYERADGADRAREGSRNGYAETTVKTTTGPVILQRPRLRGTTEKFASRLLGAGVTKTNALESLVIAGFVRGLSTRDVEATLTEALGEQASRSKSTVSRVCAAITTEFDCWCTRRLDEIELLLVPGRVAFQVPRERRRRAGAGRLEPTANRSSSGWRLPLASRPTRGSRF